VEIVPEAKSLPGQDFGTNANLAELDEWIRRRQLEPEWNKITPM